MRTLLPLLLAGAMAAAPGLGREAGAGQDVRSARQAYDRAVALEAEGNHPAALSLLWAAAGAAPRDADIQQRLGEALQRIGALDAAIDAYRQALAARPDALRSMNALVVALVAAGRGQEAVARAEAWAGARPDDPDRLFTLGLAQSEQDVDGALRTMRQVIDRRPDHALAHYNLALLLKRIDRVDEAVLAARRAAALDGRPEAHLALASLHVLQGDFAGAEAAIDDALAADRRSVEGWLMLGSVRRGRGDLPRAAEALRRAIALRPDAWGAHAALATVLVRAGDVAAAQERFAAAIAAADSYAPAHYNLGRALERLGRLDDARQAFARAHRLNPSLVSPIPER